MDTEVQAKKSPRDWLRVFAGRWCLCLLGASLFAIVVLIAGHWLPRKYTGVAKFTRRIDPAAEQLVTSKSESFDTRKLTLQNDLAGDKAVEKVVEDMNLARNLPRTSGGSLTAPSEMQKQELVRKIKAAIKVDWEVRSDQVDLVSVTYTDPDPLLAQNIPNVLVNNYIGWVSQQIVDRLKASEVFLEDAKDKCQRQLDTITAEKIQFETKHAGAMPQSPGVLDEQIRGTSRDLDTLKRQMEVAEAKLKYLKCRSGDLSATQPSAARPFVSMECERAKAELHDSKNLLENMRTIRGMKEKHPEFQAQKMKIEQLEAEVARLENQPVDMSGPTSAPGYPGMNLEVSVILGEIETLKRQEASLVARQQEYRQLQMEYEVVAKDYDSILRRLKDKEEETKKWDAQHLQVQMALAAESAKKRTQHEAIVAAQPQFRPSFPTPLMVIALALLGGLGFGGSLVFLAHALDRTIATSEEAVKSFGVDVFGVIGEIVTDGQLQRRKLRKWVGRPAAILIIVPALALAVLSIVLALYYPDEFRQWRASPVGYIVSQVSHLKL